MGSERFTLDPELEGILREVAADPRSTLLRMERPQAIRGFFSRQNRVSAQSAGLTAIERQILDVHRSDLALSLRKACMIELMEHPSTRGWLDKHVTVDQPFPLTPAHEWKVQAQDLLNQHVRDHFVDDAQQLLVRCVAGETKTSMSVLQMAAASMRLQASDESRLYAATSLIARGSPRTAMRMFRDVITGPASNLNRSYAWENVALILSNEGHFERAAAASRRSHTAHLLRCEPIMNWLFNSTLAVSQTDALAAAARLEELVPTTHESVDDYVQIIESQRRDGAWSASADAIRLSQLLKERLGPSSRKILHVIR